MRRRIHRSDAGAGQHLHIAFRPKRVSPHRAAIRTPRRRRNLHLLVERKIVGFEGFEVAVFKLDGEFFAYLNLFMFSMLLLVLASSFLVVFVAWELVGLCSYLLIGFWYRKRSAALAAKKAFIVNRVGDVGFALGIMAIFVNTGTLNIADSLEKVPEKHRPKVLPPKPAEKPKKKAPVSAPMR